LSEHKHSHSTGLFQMRIIFIYLQF
jgi:hypothetical protein